MLSATEILSASTVETVVERNCKLQVFISKLRVVNYELNLELLFSKTFAESNFETAFAKDFYGLNF